MLLGSGDSAGRSGRREGGRDGWRSVWVRTKEGAGAIWGRLWRGGMQSGESRLNLIGIHPG